MVARRPSCRAAQRTSLKTTFVILFLDFDGVLHPDPCTDPARLFERAPKLTGVLQAFPEVSIVLSTSWRTHLPLSALTEPLPAVVRERVIDITPEFSRSSAPAQLVPYRRQAECTQWLHAQGEAETQWLALDDRASLFAPYCEQLILCESMQGLTDATAARLYGALLRARLRMLRQVDATI
jgi:HAD domain in Swiss Army Knife RNA repair proteins